MMTSLREAEADRGDSHPAEVATANAHNKIDRL